jgi:transposase
MEGLHFLREAPLELEPQELERVFRERACGLDVHFSFVTACLIVPGKGKRLRILEETFETTVKGLNRLKAWLTENECEAVGMEATGVYWMPVYAALEGAFDLEVANPLQIKTLRGQKTDRKDARWIAEQVRHGRIKRSFVPPPEFRDARKLARFRRQLIQARTTISNEIQRTLAESGITLAAWVSDILGVSGMAILEALAAGKSIQDELPDCLKTSLKKKMAPIAAALEAPLGEVSRGILALHLERLEQVEVHIARVEGDLFKVLEPHADKIAMLMTIPGLARMSAAIILAEIGVNMAAWPKEKQFSAWAGVAPGCKETGGKAKRAPVRKGNPYLCTILMECAGPAVKKKDCHLNPKYHRLCRQLGSKKKARMAIAHKLALIIYRNLAASCEYKEPVPKPMTKKVHAKIRQKRIADLERLGYKVTLEPLESVS